MIIGGNFVLGMKQLKCTADAVSVTHHGAPVSLTSILKTVGHRIA